MQARGNFLESKKVFCCCSLKIPGGHHSRTSATEVLCSGYSLGSTGIVINAHQNSWNHRVLQNLGRNTGSGTSRLIRRPGARSSATRRGPSALKCSPETLCLDSKQRSPALMEVSSSSVGQFDEVFFVSPYSREHERKFEANIRVELSGRLLPTVKYRRSL